MEQWLGFRWLFHVDCFHFCFWINKINRFNEALSLLLSLRFHHVHVSMGFCLLVSYIFIWIWSHWPLVLDYSNLWRNVQIYWMGFTHAYMISASLWLGTLFPSFFSIFFSSAFFLCDFCYETTIKNNGVYKCYAQFTFIRQN